MLPTFQIFGSGDSTDIDIVFFVNELPKTIVECAGLCAAFAHAYKKRYPTHQPINANIACLQEGVLSNSFKGNLDELNNALFYTYSLHAQSYPNQITRCLQRDVHLKFLRASRSILSHCTKSQYRVYVKNALKGDIILKCTVLATIPLEQLDWGSANLTEIKKSMSFQIGQTLALHAGTECYTKTEIKAIYPELATYLNRQPDTDFKSLQRALNHFVEGLKIHIPQMRLKVEYKYGDDNVS